MGIAFVIVGAALLGFAVGLRYATHQFRSTVIKISDDFTKTTSEMSENYRRIVGELESHYESRSRIDQERIEQFRRAIRAGHSAIYAISLMGGSAMMFDNEYDF